MVALTDRWGPHKPDAGGWVKAVEPPRPTRVWVWCTVHAHRTDLVLLRGVCATRRETILCLESVGVCVDVVVY